MTIPFDPRRPPTPGGSPPPDPTAPPSPTDGASDPEAPFAFPGGDAVDTAAFQLAARDAMGLHAPQGLDAAPPADGVHHDGAPGPLALGAPDADDALSMSPTPPMSPTPDADDAPEPVDPAEHQRQQRRALAAQFGVDFPLLQDEPADADWTRWASSLWERHRAAMAPMLRTAARNRSFRRGQQWIAWRGDGWREPPAPKDEARLVHNMIRPALALRQQVVSEQRPGFRVEPTQQTPTAQKSAEAQQRALEVLYAETKMASVLREAAFWAGTDGVAFLEGYWNPDGGPDDEVAPGQRRKLGQLATCVLRIEQVRVSANATATERPHYWVTRRVISLAEAVARYGPQVAGTRSADALGGLGVSLDGLGLPASGSIAGQTGDRRGVPPTQLLTDQETVDLYHVYCEPTAPDGALPAGLMLVVCGDAVVNAGDLPWGVVPLVRVTDGSEDPAFFPEPLMNDWIDHQKRTNALISKVYENIRVNAPGGRLLTRPGAIKGETLVGGVLSMLEVAQGVSMAEAVQPIPAFSILRDALEQLKFEIQAFEQKSGWSDATRGSFDSGESGRSILAQRETVERIFTPPVTAVAESATRWAEVAIHGMRWGYDVPRWIGATGGDRPDLGLSISADDFAGVGTVHIDPETLMPMPRSLRLFLLDSMLEKGVMSPDEYRQRLPFAYTGSLSTPKTHKEARARRIALAIQQGTPLPDPRWTDDESIIQTVLEEEILDVDKPDDPSWGQKVAQATQVWMRYAQQAAQKAGPPMPPPGAPGGHGPPSGPHAPGLPPDQQPFPGTNPGVASAPAAVLASGSDASHAQQMDGMLGR